MRLYHRHETAAWTSGQCARIRPERHDGMRRETRIGRRLSRAASRKTTSRT